MLCLCLIGLSACHSAPQVYQEESYVFGTRVEIQVAGMPQDQAKSAVESVLAYLDTLHLRLHAWQVGSELTQINQAIAKGQSIKVEPDVAGLIRSSSVMEQKSNGLFAPAIGHLVAQWGFHADTYNPVHPAIQQLQAWLQPTPSLMSIEWKGNELSSKDTRVSLDLGGIAKGWALDQVATRLKAHGVKSALINIGGNVIAMGTKPDGELWKVGIQDPRRNEAMAVISLKPGEAIGTSGDYQRYFMMNQIRYCHLIDPRNGSAACQTQSATLIAPAGHQAGLLSDVASKPLYFAKPNELVQYAKRFGVEDFLVIDHEGRAWESASMAKRIKWLVKPAQIHIL